MPYTPILATLGYVFSPDRTRVLLVHRNARPGDHHLGKYNGLGGKLERDEDIVAGMKREVLEEAGIVCESLQLAGTISWPGFGKNGEDWFGFLFRILSWSGTPAEKNPEGSLSWVKVTQVMNLPMWEGDRHFLPFILDFQALPFHAVMPYHQGRPTGWTVNSATA
ncbi:NUDIX hydrolase [Limnoglobus roseus]|uniref:8-oxo-dGTP diphosphatase n=1 Tax=Limnoglobus roseus TaxID=2598579 RepID=A0A5C1AFK4_9BACT|nr:8-oxo-dGTP diphosphatase [Limnoglobus roseus]